MNSDRVVLEVRVLRALCACADTATARAAVQRLARYEWSGADHAVVFDAIRSALESGAALTQENLIVMATRAGFPDVDLIEYFAPRHAVELDLALRELERLGDLR